MKRFLTILTIAILALSMGACGSKNKSQTPEQHAEKFVKQVFDALDADDFGRLETIGNEMGEYINGLTEEQGEEFGEAFATKFYEYSDKYEYGEEFASAFLMAMASAFADDDSDLQ
ncbi:MAG: hypothetical protein K2F95_01070 [Alistipes sp.]|nr:hypothetical protein [Alistipes sp.]